MLDPRLNHVVAVARCGSITAAAQMVGVTQSAVTRSIADLEGQIGYAIFYRTSRGTIPTERGRDFIDRASRLLEDARELLNRSGEREDPYAVVVRVGVAPASLEWLLAEPLTKLLRQHPSIRYDISSSSFESMVQQLRTGRVDVAVGFDAAFSQWSDLRRVPMGALKSTLFVRKKHPLLKLPKVALSDLAAYEFVSPSDSRPYGEIIRSLYESQRVDWRRRLHIVDYFPMVRRIVATSNAIGVAAISAAESAAFRRDFQSLDGLDPFPTAPLCCAVRARWEPKLALRSLIGTICDSIPEGSMR